ncbi:piggyBac transposable element-derived protein 1 [Nannospalax galili]|uniref:piggyBac transposable element-derived protein 1 n=1 Tax=Nannospalax galili TaxID=1026970 RepID=UPI00111BECAA|nr:piggyBac transposable element-derived protein 1 [Nannospalax galili]
MYIWNSVLKDILRPSKPFLASKFNMDEALPVSAPEDAGGLLTVKVEDPSWEPPSLAPEGRTHTQELCRLQFWQFHYQEVPGPREALAQLRELCHQWLKPETHTKEQIFELLVLEQFLIILPKELHTWVQMYRLQSGSFLCTGTSHASSSDSIKKPLWSVRASRSSNLGSLPWHMNLRSFPQKVFSSENSLSPGGKFQRQPSSP